MGYNKVEGNTMKINEITKELDKYLTEEERNSIDPRAMVEMATIVTDRKGQHIIKNISTNPDSTRNWYEEEYFKVYDNLSVSSAKKLARIKFRSPEYVVHTGSNWELNSKEKKDLIKFLNESNKKVPYVKNNWEYAILMFNQEAYQDEESMEDLVITIKEQSEMDESNPRKYYLPIDLPMPDYTKL